MREEIGIVFEQQGTDGSGPCSRAPDGTMILDVLISPLQALLLSSRRLLRFARSTLDARFA